MDWSSVTSNLIIPSLIALAGFAWSKVRSEKTDSWSGVIDGIKGQLVHQLVILGTDHEADLRLRANAWVGLNIGRLKLPVDNAIVTSLVNAMIEQAISEALAELRANDANVASNLTTIAGESKATVDSFAAAQAEGLARVAGMKDLIEVVPPDPPAAATIAKPAPPAESK